LEFQNIYFVRDVPDASGGQLVMKINKNEVKEMLRQAMVRRRPDPPRRILSAERAATKFIGKWMKDSGFDHKAFLGLKEQHRKELDKELERQRVKDRNSRRANLAHAAIVKHAQVFQQAAAFGGFFPHPSTTLSFPFLVLAEPDSSILKETNIVQFDTSVKVRVDKRRSSVDQVTFLYFFQNVSSTAATVDAVTFLSAAGRLSVTESGDFAGASLGSIIAIAEFEAALNQPSAVVKSEAKTLAAVSAVGGPFTIDGHESRTFSEGLQMSVSGIIVPAQATIFFKVSVVFESDFQPGRAIADLESGNFGIHNPLVLVVVKGQQRPASVTE
jgi:hypothetical protein